MMLKLFIDDILKAENIKAETTPWDLGSFKGNKADIVVAPVDMEPHLRDYPAKIVLVKNLVDKGEIKEKILRAIDELSHAEGGKTI
ncbi:PTS system, ascorbate-specific IIB component [Pelolinea submarina]|nr:PTS system, ascorbate-specific IIB component [Pelolinea submarina]